MSNISITYIFFYIMGNILHHVVVCLNHTNNHTLCLNATMHVDLNGFYFLVSSYVKGKKNIKYKWIKNIYNFLYNDKVAIVTMQTSFIIKYDQDILFYSFMYILTSL